MTTITIPESNFNDANQRLQSAKATLVCLAAGMREGIIGGENSAEAIQGLAFAVGDACELLNAETHLKTEASAS